MANIKVLQCKNCGMPLPSGSLKCEYCGAENLLDAEVNPLQLTPEMANRYTEFFKKKSEENPKDGGSLFAMGLIYLGLKNFSLAKRNFEASIDLNPFDPDVYYYLALSLFEGESPSVIDYNTAKRIDELLTTAINRQAKRKYLILAMFLREGAFVSQGLAVSGKKPEELMPIILSTAPEGNDLLEITENIRITDPKNLEYLARLKGEKSRGRHENRAQKREAMHNACLYPRKDDDQYIENEEKDAELLYSSKETRGLFFKYLCAPERPKKFSKASYPIGKIIISLFAALVLTIFTISLASLFNAFDYLEVKERPTVETVFQERYADVKLSDKERKEAFTAIREEQAEEVRKDSAYHADFFNYMYDVKKDESKMVYWFWDFNEEDRPNVIVFYGFKKSLDTLYAILLGLSAILVWLIKTILSVSRVRKKRKAVNNANISEKKGYDLYLRAFNSRNTIKGHVAFCRHFLSGNSKSVRNTDPVTAALNEINYNEADLMSKILFVNQFDLGETADPRIVLRKVYYTVAVPQKDRLTILYNCWDTLDNSLEPCEKVAVFYKNINSVSVDDEEIHIGMVGGGEKSITLPYDKRHCLLEYQSEDPGDELTFSLTRTGDPQEFVFALENLISSQQRL